MEGMPTIPGKDPEIMMTGGDSKGGANSAMDAIGLNMLMGLTEKLSKK